jgi:hypothetical protein
MFDRDRRLRGPPMEEQISLAVESHPEEPFGNVERSRPMEGSSHFLDDLELLRHVRSDDVHWTADPGVGDGKSQDPHNVLEMDPCEPLFSRAEAGTKPEPRWQRQQSERWRGPVDHETGPH